MSLTQIPFKKVGLLTSELEQICEVAYSTPEMEFQEQGYQTSIQVRYMHRALVIIYLNYNRHRAGYEFHNPGILTDNMKEKVSQVKAVLRKFTPQP